MLNEPRCASWAESVKPVPCHGTAAALIVEKDDTNATLGVTQTFPCRKEVLDAYNVAYDANAYLLRKSCLRMLSSLLCYDYA